MRLMRFMVAGCLVGTGCVQGDDPFPLPLPDDEQEPEVPEDPVPGDPVVQVLSLDHQIGSPLPDPTGITFDGSQLWLINGGHNSASHRLVRYDDENYTITRELSLDGLIESAGTGVYGIEWDGKNIWVSVSGNTNKLVAIDPESGQVVKTWASPSNLGPSDLAFDSSLMWLGDGTGSVFAMDLDTGGVQTSFTVDRQLIRDNGIVVHDGLVMVNALFGHGQGIYTTEGELVGRDLTPTGPMAIARGQVVALQSGQIVFYDLDMN